MPADCLFCRIGRGEIPATQASTRTTSCFAIRDINPQAPTHVLVIRGRARRLRGGADGGRRAAPRPPVRGRRADLARAEGLDGGWRLVTNVGPDGGQSVGHLHVHLLGGRPMRWPPG